MKHILTVLLFLALIAIMPATERLVARLDNPPTELFKQLLTQGADIAAYRPGIYLDLVLNDVEYNLWKTQYPALHVTQTEAMLKSNLLGDRDIPGYRDYDQMVTELMQLQAQYPSLMQTSVLGTGWGSVYAGQNINQYQDFDHNIWAVKVSANVELTEDEPAFYFVGEHHAREPISTEVCMGILINLLENYGTDPVVTSILNTTEIWIVPLLNPDGHKIVIDQTDVWWRKNIRDNNDNETFDHDNSGYGWDGVDLNRNYGYFWGYNSSTDDNQDATYHGPDPFSEPETQILRDLILSRRYLAGIGYHTYGQLVLFPYGYVNGMVAPDAQELEALANEVAAVLPGQSGGTYDPGPSWGLYPASGTLDDWSYAMTGTFSYTIEMAEQFIPSATAIPQIVAHQVNGAKTLIQRKNRKILQGHVTDADTGLPLVATVHIDGFDDNPVYRVPIKSDSLFGAYYRLLPIGNYNVRYLCPGYETVERNITILMGEPTIEDISMAPTAAYDLNVQIVGDFFGGVAGATLLLNNDPATIYTSDTNGNILISGFHPGQHFFRVSKNGYETLNLLRHVSTPNISLRISSQPTIFDDFEENMNRWTTTGTWNRTTNDHYYGAYCLTDSPTGNYASDSNTTCRLTSPLNLQNVENANLQFWVRTELALDSDCLLLEYSTNGSTWTIGASYTGSLYWTLQSLNLNSFIGQNLYIRFRLSTDGGGWGNGVFIDGFKVYASSDVTATDDPIIPTPFVTMAAYPNPFAGVCSLFVKTDSALDDAELRIYNLKGQLVKSISKENLTSGVHPFVWDGENERGLPVASGIYMAQLISRGKTVSTQRLAYIK